MVTIICHLMRKIICSCVSTILTKIALMSVHRMNCYSIHSVKSHKLPV